MQILHQESGMVLNRLPRILRSENGNSALQKWKFNAQEWTFCAQKMEIFPNAMESQWFFHAKSGNSIHFCSAALKSKVRAEFCDRRILERLKFYLFIFFDSVIFNWVMARGRCSYQSVLLWTDRHFSHFLKPDCSLWRGQGPCWSDDRRLKMVRDGWWRWICIVSWILHLKEFFCLNNILYSVIEGEAVACVHDVFTDCWVWIFPICVFFELNT